MREMAFGIASDKKMAGVHLKERWQVGSPRERVKYYSGIKLDEEFRLRQIRGRDGMEGHPRERKA